MEHIFTDNNFVDQLCFLKESGDRPPPGSLQLQVLGKGTNGVSTHGITAKFMISFGPISVDPICPQPKDVYYIYIYIYI